MNIQFDYPEGATPIDDISGLKIHWVKTQEDLNRVEAENIAKTTSKYLMKAVSGPQTWFKVANLKKIHKEMFFDVWDWAGTFRNTQTHPGVKPFLIGHSLTELCFLVSFWCKEGCRLTFLEQAARIHHRLVEIHPFKNGNGRFSRLIADRYLKSWRCPFPSWPTELQGDNQLRKQYISSLKAADAGNHEELVIFMEKCGAKDPSLSEILGTPFFKGSLQGKRLMELIKAHLDRGYLVNETINNGHHPLQLAIKLGEEKVAKILISSGANIHFRDKSGLTSFEMAIANHHLLIAKMLYDNGYPYVPRTPPPPQLTRYYSNLYEFERRFF